MFVERLVDELEAELLDVLKTGDSNGEVLVDVVLLDSDGDSGLIMLLSQSSSEISSDSRSSA